MLAMNIPGEGWNQVLQKIANLFAEECVKTNGKPNMSMIEKAVARTRPARVEDIPSLSVFVCK